MVRLVYRRMSDPKMVSGIWDAISKIREQKQTANCERIAAYLQRVMGIDPALIPDLLSEVVSDGLVVKTHNQAKNGRARTSIEQYGYWILGDEVKRDGHDWYCGECHLSGEVLLCDQCPRVYHPRCNNLNNFSTESDKKWRCTYCLEIQSTSKIEKQELNKLLGYVIFRLMDKTQTLHIYNYDVPQGDDNLYNSLVYQPMDLANISNKAEKHLYFSKAEFYGDVKLILHNCIIHFGADSEQATLAALVVDECQQELNEIQLCKDCYYWSNNKKQRDWFCQPCSPPHELVWARLKGFGYWPAKVILRLEFKADVRFFGRHHERAWIPVDSVKPINTSLIKLLFKRSVGWKSACAELKKHQQILKMKGVNYSAAGSSAVNTSTHDNAVVTKLSPQTNTHTFHKTAAQSSGSADVDDNYLLSKRKSRSRGPKRTASPGGVGGGSTVSETTDSSEDETSPQKKVKPVRVDKFPTKPSTHNKHKLQLNKSADADDPESGRSSPWQHSESEYLNTSVTETVSQSVQTDVIVCVCGRYIPQLHTPNTGTDVNNESKLSEPVSTSDRGELLHTNRHPTHCPHCQCATHLTSDDSGESEMEKVRQQSAIDRAVTSVREEFEKKLKSLTDEHLHSISRTKRKQWCVNCENEAKYHCCWNNAYCSPKCQKEHWHREHKKTCQRKALARRSQEEEQ